MNVITGEGPTRRCLPNRSGNRSTSLIDQAPRGVLIQCSKSRHIERQLSEDSCIAIRSHRDQPDMHQLAREFPNGMHSQELQILAPENELENLFFLADDATVWIAVYRARPTT
jgi:hypothetical protein